MRILLFALTAALAASSARAGELRDFCAERPGKATPPCILDAGHLQLEMGLADAVFDRGHGVHAETYSIAAAEVRFGISRRTEVEAAWTPLIVNHDRGAGRASGVGDTTLGLRAALTDPDAAGPAVSLQGFVTAPTATRGMGAGGWTGGARLPVSIPLGPMGDLGLSPEVDVVRDAAGGGTHLAWIGAAGVTRGFGQATLGAEVWAEIDDDPTGRAYQASADLSAAFAAGPDAQLDAGVSLGLNRTTPDVEIYAGVVRRF